MSGSLNLAEARPCPLLTLSWADDSSHLSDSPVIMSPNSRVPAMMNRRRDNDGGGEESKGLSKWSRGQRLAGKGLSLVAFSNAKSKRLDYNPSFIKKQKEFHRNAKFVSKFKKSLKSESRYPPSETPLHPQEGSDGGSHGMIKNKKKKYSLQKAREEYEKRQAEEEKARMEREAMIQAKKDEKQRAELRRKELRRNMFKRTQSGQPVMKYRIEHILDSIQASGT